MSNDNTFLNRKDHLIDSSKALRYSYNADEKALDIINHGASMIPKRFNRQIPTIDANHNTTSISFYDDNVVEISKLTAIADVSQNLASKYFVLYSGRDRVKFYIWYKVSGLGTDPAISGATGIQVDITTNDFAAVVALATINAINIAAPFYFKTERLDAIFHITTKHGGETTDTVDGDSGFSFVTEQDGSSELGAIMDIVYSSDYDIVSTSTYSSI